MKKQTQPTKKAPQRKGFLSLAGEALHVLGEEIIEGKDKVVEAASDKFSAVKKAITHLAHKKTASARPTVKKAVKKTATKKSVKKAPKKAARAKKKA